MGRSKSKRLTERFIELKVYKNKKTGQGLVMLPKKKIGEIPKKVKVKW